MDTRLKYVRLEEFNEIIIFPEVIMHSDFKHMKPVSAGFCYIRNNEVQCFGESISLGLSSHKNDTFHATRQVFGMDAAMKFME